MTDLEPILINTPLQPGGRVPSCERNRFNFNGFQSGTQTVEPVRTRTLRVTTPLKRGANET
jgi:hypothetical protein